MFCVVWVLSFFSDFLNLWIWLFVVFLSIVVIYWLGRRFGLCKVLMLSIGVVVFLCVVGGWCLCVGRLLKEGRVGMFGGCVVLKLVGILLNCVE